MVQLSTPWGDPQPGNGPPVRRFLSNYFDLLFWFLANRLSIWDLYRRLAIWHEDDVCNVPGLSQNDSTYHHSVLTT